MVVYCHKLLHWGFIVVFGSLLLLLPLQLLAAALPETGKAVFVPNDPFAVPSVVIIGVGK